MVSPLRDAEEELVRQAARGISDANTQKLIADRASDKANRAAGNASSHEEREQLTAEAMEMAMMAEAITVPVLPRLFADDTTPEAAQSLIAEHRRLTIVSAEGGIFDILAGRYSIGSNLDWALKGHAGDTIRVDRKGRPPEYVKSPALSMILAVQPSVLSAIGNNQTFKGRGLLARFLYSLPASNVGNRIVGAEPVSDEVGTAYSDSIQLLALTLAEWIDPIVLQLEPAAEALSLEYEGRIESRLLPEQGDLGYSAMITEWASKVVGAMVRIAGLLHLAADPASAYRQPVSATTVTAALAIVDYFTAHAIAAFEWMSVDPALADANYLLNVIKSTGAETISSRDLFSSSSHSRFRRMGDINIPVSILEDHGYLVRLPEKRPTARGGRPPSPVWGVHPDCLQ